ncbi:spore germination protein [Tepidibacillus fermentans]|uniref:Stage V sporulation protein AF n=1 Tax=Tepidibacillus fermentans TaxID=1281767 RepID=A0A4R3KJX9_9BACI|nr:spore germination protein [Tepidibacillus fermentans]TCS84091.1 stage V sporulation protein AF [Tepidibacillus fermentans]
MKKGIKLKSNGTNEKKGPETATIDTTEESLQKTLHISRDIEENKNILDEKLGVGKSFDLICREMNFGGKDFAIYFVNGFANSDVMTQILKELANLKREDLVPNTLKHLIETYVSHIQVNKIKTINEANDNILSGQLVMLIDGEKEGLVIDVRSYPGRTPQEPDTERVVRGSRDGFTETLVVNTALTRRRIRDERLRMEIQQVGERSKTDVCIAYLQDVADPGLVNLVKQKIQEISIDGLPMSERSLNEFLIGRSWNPYPMVRYTERPDVAAQHLLEGHVLIYVDTSPGVIITPTTFFHHVQHAEESRQNPMTGTYIRWIRFFGVIASLFLLPLWLIYVYEPNLLPHSLEFIGPKDTSKIPIFFQFILAELGIDLMRMAAVHTPTPLATAMGLIAAVLIGEVAIKVGLFVPEVILYLSIAAIGMYATPSYELGLANKIARLIFLLAVYLFKIPGFVFATTIWLIVLTMTNSLNTPYLWPFIPFNFHAMVNILLRKPVPFMNKRPSIVHPQNQNRQ